MTRYFVLGAILFVLSGCATIPGTNMNDRVRPLIGKPISEIQTLLGEATFRNGDSHYVWKHNDCELSVYVANGVVTNSELTAIWSFADGILGGRGNCNDLLRTRLKLPS